MKQLLISIPYRTETLCLGYWHHSCSFYMFLHPWSLLLFILTTQFFFFSIQLTGNHHFLCTRGIFPGKSFPTFCVSNQNFDYLNVNDSLLQQQMFISKKMLQIICLLLLWTLTLVLAVAVSVLMSQLTVGARPVTRCLLAGQEDHTQKEERMHKRYKVNKTVLS